MRNYRFKGDLFGYVVSYLTITYFLSDTAFVKHLYITPMPFIATWFHFSLVLFLFLGVLGIFLGILFNIFFEKKEND